MQKISINNTGNEYLLFQLCKKCRQAKHRGLHKYVNEARDCRFSNFSWRQLAPKIKSPLLES